MPQTPSNFMRGYIGDDGDRKDEHDNDGFCTDGDDENRKHVTPCDLHRLLNPNKVMIRDYNAGDCTCNEEKDGVFSPSKWVEPRSEIEQV